MRILKRIIISGEGGQGIQVISKALCIAANLSGQESVYVANYGVEQRGGTSLGFVQVSNKEIGFPKFQFADIIVVLSSRAAERVKEYVKRETIVYYDDESVEEKILQDLSKKKTRVSAAKIAREKLIPKVFNMIFLGVLGKELGIEEKYLKKAISEILGDKYDKSPQLKNFNERAIELGIHYL